MGPCPSIPEDPRDLHAWQDRAGRQRLEYSYAGHSPDVKRQIAEMALNANGIRDTARVLHVSPTTVIKELKKKNLTSSR